MIKNELVHFMANKTNLKIDEAEAALDAFTKGVTESLARGANVTLVGFGTFQIKDRSARKGRNPKTGEAIQIKASKVPSFKAGKGLKDTLNLRK